MFHPLAHSARRDSVPLRCIGSFSNIRPFAPGQSPLTNGSITSGDDRFRLIMQTDGKLVLYHVNNAPAWASNTLGKPGSLLVMQNNGNLVIDQPILPIFASNTVQQ
jgi:hypothetical protein